MRLRRILGWTAAIPLVLLLLAALAWYAADTQPGRDLLVRQLALVQPKSGLRISADRLTGSLYGELVIENLTLRDPDGVFLTSPRVLLDWDYRQLIFRRHLDVKDLQAPRVTLHRRPRLNEGAGGPLLPDLRISIGSFGIGEAVLERPVTGTRHILSASGKGLAEDGRASLDLRLRSETGGDRLVLSLDAVPEEDRFALSGSVSAPAQGVIAGLAGLPEGMAISLTGRGRWSRWQGSLRAHLPATDQLLANFRIDAAQGLFQLEGRAAPAALFGGIVERLMPRGVGVSASLAAGERDVPFVLRLKSPAVSLDGRGVIDTEMRELESTRAVIALKRPAALLRELSGEDMQLQVDLAGAPLDPTGSYRFSATAFALGDQRLVAPRASGRFGGDLAPGAFTIAGEMRRLDGAGELVRDLSQSTAIQGVLTLDDLLVRGRDVDVQTAEAEATADLALDLSTGRYEVSTSVRVPDYRIPEAADVAVTGRLRLRPDPAQARKLLITGPVQARVTRLDNSFLQFVFGGMPSGSANVVRTADGTVRFSGARFEAPSFSGQASGAYRLGQQISISGDGVHERFGPLDFQLEGDLARPAADILAQEYSLGLPLRRIRGRFRPDSGGYDFTAAAGSPLGRARAVGRIDLGEAGPLYRFERITLAGLEASGALQPSGGIPVSGTLAISGRGLDGTADFSAAGEAQAIRVRVSAADALLNAGSGFFIGSGTAAADVVVGEGRRRASGSFDLAGARYGRIALSAADGRFALENGAGEVRAQLAGRRGKPFEVTLEADFTGERIALDAEGQFGRRPFALANTAILTPAGDGWRLAETRLDLPAGYASISGRSGARPQVAVDLVDAGLSPLAVVFPALDFDGTTTGSIRYSAAGPNPVGEVRLKVQDFVRSTGALARPIDGLIAAGLRGDAAAVRAVLSDGDVRLGRFEARLRRLGGDPAGLVERLLEAPVEGQFRFDGPAESVWPLAGIGTVAVAGPINASVRIGGVVGDPQLGGTIASNDLRFESVPSGTVIEDIDLKAHFAGSLLLLDEFTGRSAGGGGVSGSGSVDLSFARGFPIDIAITADDAELIDIDTLEARVSGDLALSSDLKRGGRVTGDLRIDRASYRPGAAQLDEIPALDVVEVNTEFARARPEASVDAGWQLDVKAEGNNRILVRGQGLSSEWAVDFDIDGPVREPRVTGTAELVDGEYDFAGRRFELTRGEIAFSGNYPPDPALDIDAEARVEGLSATISIRGLASQPEIRLSSVPSLPQDEILSRILFGASISDLSAPEAVQLAGAVAALQSGGSSALDPIGSIRDALGVDRLRLQSGEGPEGGTGIAAGEYIGRRTYVEIATDTEGNSATQVEYALTRAFSLLGRVATFGGNSIGVRVSNDY